MLKTKTPKESAIEMREIVMPNQVNPHGVVFGGQIMAWIDLAAAMVAERHAECPVATVHVGNITFINPAKVGDHIRILASANYAGQTSLEIGVKVLVESPYSGNSEVATKAYVTMVAINSKGQPQPVHKLSPETSDEKRRFQDAILRKKKA